MLFVVVDVPKVGYYGRGGGKGSAVAAAVDILCLMCV
jgi:hypothetical protein